MDLKNHLRLLLLLLLVLNGSWRSASAASQDWCASYSLKIAGRVTAMAFSPSRRVFADAVQPDFRRENYRLIELRSAPSYKVMRRIKTNSRPWTLSFSPDGTLVASGHKDMTTRLWQVRTGKLLRTLHRKENEGAAVTSVAFSPATTMLASAGHEIEIYLWNWKTGKLLRKIGHNMDVTRSLSFSKDGRTLASATAGDNAIKLWDVHTGRLQRVLQHSSNSQTFYVTYSHDFSLLASSDERGNVKIWSSRTGKLLRSFVMKSKFDDQATYSEYLMYWSIPLAFSPDDTLIAGGGFDYGVHLWQVKTGIKLPVLPGHRDRVRVVAFSSPGNKLLSASRDGVLRIWRRKARLGHSR